MPTVVPTNNSEVPTIPTNNSEDLLDYIVGTDQGTLNQEIDSSVTERMVATDDDHVSVEGSQETSQPDSQEVQEDDSDDDNSQDSEEDDPATLIKTYQLAKNTVECITITNRNGPNASPAWGYYSYVTIREGLGDDLSRFDNPAYEHIKGRLSNQKYPHVAVCNICFDDPSKSLMASMNPTSVPHHAGNFGKHLRSIHCIELPSKSSKSKPKSLKRPPTAPPASAKKRNCTLQRLPHSIISVNNSPSPNASSVTPFETNVAMGRQATFQLFHELTFAFANNNNIAANAIVNPKKPEFRDLINFAIRHAATLRNIHQSELFMGKAKLTSIRTKSFEKLMAGAKLYGDEVRAYYKDRLRKTVPWVIVAQDGWDSKRKDLLGVTIFFYHPVRNLVFRIPIGLIRLEDKKADPTKEDVLRCLSRVGVQHDDIFKAVNDTTNCLLYTSPSPRDQRGSRMPSSA